MEDTDDAQEPPAPLCCCPVPAVGQAEAAKGLELRGAWLRFVLEPLYSVVLLGLLKRSAVLAWRLAATWPVPELGQPGPKPELPAALLLKADAVLVGKSGAVAVAANGCP